MTLNRGATLNSHTFSMETHWLVSITVMSQGVCVLDQSLKVSAPHSPNFPNVPTTLDLLFFPKQQFSNKKIDVLRKSFNWKLISASMSRDVQKPLFDFCMSQIITVLAGEIWISFSSHKIALCPKSPHFDGVTLSNFGCVYLIETHAQWSSHFRIRKREAVLCIAFS